MANRISILFALMLPLFLLLSANFAHAAAGPKITVVSNITGVTATSASGASVNFALPTAMDQYNVTLSVSCADSTGPLTSGSTFPMGTTTVTCTATDRYGNTTMTSFTVAVGKRPTSTSVSCVTPFLFGTATPCTASVKGYLGRVAGESLTLLSSSTMVNGGGTSTGTFTGCTLGSTGSCSFTYTYPVAGSPSVSAVYAGDSVNAGSSSLSAPFTMEAVAVLPSTIPAAPNATAVNATAAQQAPVSSSLLAIASTGLTIAVSVAVGIAIGMVYQRRRSRAAKWRKRA
jgi:large repetitive protein